MDMDERASGNNVTDGAPMDSRRLAISTAIPTMAPTMAQGRAVGAGAPGRLPVTTDKDVDDK
jgi:hypothetical protein